MFDPPMDFRAYIQSKGRARDQNSNYIILVNRSDASFDKRYSQYREVENTLKNVSNSEIIIYYLLHYNSIDVIKFLL